MQGGGLVSVVFSFSLDAKQGVAVSQALNVEGIGVSNYVPCHNPQSFLLFPTL